MIRKNGSLSARGGWGNDKGSGITGKATKLLYNMPAVSDHRDCGQPNRGQKKNDQAKLIVLVPLTLAKGT